MSTAEMNIALPPNWSLLLGSTNYIKVPAIWAIND